VLSRICSAPLPKVDCKSILSTDSTSRSLDQSTRIESTLSIDAGCYKTACDYDKCSIMETNAAQSECCMLQLYIPDKLPPLLRGDAQITDSVYLQVTVKNPTEYAAGWVVRDRFEYPATRFVLTSVKRHHTVIN